MMAMGLFSLFQKKEKPQETIGENKKVPRWEISTPAKIKWEGQNNYTECEVKDLSLKGCCLAVAEEITKWPVRAELYFNEDFSFNVEMAVVWHKESDSKQTYGIRFSRIRDADKEKIFQMIKSNFPHVILKHWWQA